MATVPAKKKKTDLVRLDSRIVEAARVVALARGITIMTYFTGLLSEQVERDRADAIRMLSRPPQD